jgi:colanic acid/amylovoran biosynthesis glycosyltransferase
VRVAYFTNQYPAVSHTFIRREIKALEALDVTVFRYALRPGDNLVDPEDLTEKRDTRFILTAGTGEIFRCCIAMILTRPLAMRRAIREAVKMGQRSNRSIFRHLAYVAEAAVLARWCRQDTVEHIHAHFGTNSAAIALLAWRLSGIPYSFTSHGPDEFEKAEWLSLDRKLEHATFAVAVSSYGRSQLMRWSAPDQWPKIAIIHCGVDKSYLEATTTAPPDVPRFVCVARLGAEKGQLLLIAAARRLRDAGIHCEVVLAGDGKMRPQIEDSIRRAGLQNEVTITGWASGERVKAEIAATRTLVLPSFAENLPVVLMEAMALSRPVISTYVAGIPELVQPGITGWLVPAGDEIALAEAMREALETPVKLLAVMGTAGRLHVIAHHDSQKEAAKLKSLFEASAKLPLATECSP